MRVNTHYEIEVIKSKFIQIFYFYFSNEFKALDKCRCNFTYFFPLKRFDFVI